MDYWEGMMDWPLDKEWKCEICDSRSLIWGMIHAQCRCTICHAEYTMRDIEDRDIVLTIPFIMIKPEYLNQLKNYWVEKGNQLSKISDAEYAEMDIIIKGSK